MKKFKKLQAVIISLFVINSMLVGEVGVEWRIYFNEAEKLIELNQLNNALKTSERALQIATSTPTVSNNVSVIENLSQVANIHYTLKNLDYSEVHYNTALITLKSLPEKVQGSAYLIKLRIDILRNLIKIYEDKANTANFDIHSSSVKARGNLITLYLNDEDLYEKVLSQRKEILSLCEYIESPKDLAQGLNDLAFLYEIKDFGEYSSLLYEEAAKIYEQTKMPDEYFVKILNNLAGIHVSQRNYEYALTKQKQAVDILEKIHGSNHENVVSGRELIAQIEKLLKNKR
jgi:tetratricopeptide (TPR) repeat protein